LGLYTATILAELEEITRRPIARSFDLIAGTSIGGIIALGLAAEIPAKEIKTAFEENGTRIFSARRAPTSRFGAFRDTMRFMFRPKYDGVALEEAIERIVGPERRIGDLQHRIIVPTVNITKGQVQVFKTSHHPTFCRDQKLKLRDVALATSAAPTYFPLAEVGDALFADGGLYANSPDILALHEAEHFLGIPNAQMHLLRHCQTIR
jgi:patatin-like phospholipase/acyl hydrolase